MKKIIFILVTAIMLCISASIYAQSATTKLAASEEATPANVLKWAKEVLPKMKPLVPKLEKIKSTTTGKSKMDGIKYLVAVTQLKEINAKGTRLKAAEAKRYYDLIAATVNSFYIECQSRNGDVCCIDCINHGILGVWCYANCFVAKFPG
jgi:hypothetical protein